jgi:predicted nucleotidyltransferase
MPTYQELLARIAKAFDHHRIPYMVIGGQAVIRYGRPRLTDDIDITLGVDVTSLPTVQQAASEIPLHARVNDVEGMVKQTNVLPLIERSTGIKVDCIFSFTPYERQAIERGEEVAVGGTRVRYAALEDVIIHKLVANRPVDVEDVVAIIVRSGDRIDRAYLQSWLRQFSSVVDRDLWKQFEALEGTGRKT